MKYDNMLKNFEKVAYVIKKLENFYPDCLASFVTLQSKFANIYLYPVREFSKVIVLAIVKGDRVGIFLGKLASIQALLKGRKSIKSAEKIAYENKDNCRFHGAII